MCNGMTAAEKKKLAEELITIQTNMDFNGLAAFSEKLAAGGINFDDISKRSKDLLPDYHFLGFRNGVYYS